MNKLSEMESLVAKKIKEESDNVNHPAHYNREDGLECINEIEIILSLLNPELPNIGFIASLLGNIWKYRYRAADKNGIEDLKKSDWYMKKLATTVKVNKIRTNA